MSKSSYDAIVIGGGFSGLAAAACLARAGKSVVVLEASHHLGGRCAVVSKDDGFRLPQGPQTLFALEPALIKSAGLVKAGLKFAVRDMPLVSVRAEGRHIVFTRNARVTAANIAVYSKRDAEIWPRYQHELFDLGRALRPFWGGSQAVLKPKVREAFDRLARTSAMAWLDFWFESEALKAALVFDATADGQSMLEAGSALAFVWRASQEMSGLQGAVAFPRGGFHAFAQMMIASAQNAGTEIRTGSVVQSVLMDGMAAAGVRLNTGEEIYVHTVLSSLPRSTVFQRFLPPLTSGIAASQRLGKNPISEARIVVALNAKPQPALSALPLVARFVVAERPESYVEAEMAARNGVLGSELPMEIVIQTALNETLVPEGQHIVSAIIRPVPSKPQTPWAELQSSLVERVKITLARIFPDLPGAITRIAVQTPDDLPPVTVESGRLTVLPAQRIASPVDGLYFCGADAEPMTAVSGSAARIAAALASGAAP
jgi:phytoene dehydrogenase-like protein